MFRESGIKNSSDFKGLPTEIKFDKTQKNTKKCIDIWKEIEYNKSVYT